MNNIKIVLNNSELDLKDGFGFGLNYSNGDVKDPSKRNAPYSKTVKLVGTKNNNKILGGLFDVNADFTFFNPNIKTEAKIVVNSSTVIDGFLRLKSINIDKDSYIEGDEVEYECIISSQSVDFFSKIQDKDLTELDFTAHNHDLTKTNIVASWSNTAKNVFTYPLMYKDSNDYLTNDFKPAIFNKAYLKRMAKDAGYSLTGGLMDESTAEGAAYAKDIIPFNGELPEITLVEQVRRKFKASSTNPHTVTSGTINQVYPTKFTGLAGTAGFIESDLTSIDNDSTGVNFDNGSNFSTVLSEWTPDVDGSYGIHGTFDIECDFTVLTACSINIQKRSSAGAIEYAPYLSPDPDMEFKMSVGMFVDGVLKFFREITPIMDIPTVLSIGDNTVTPPTSLNMNFPSVYLLSGQVVSFRALVDAPIYSDSHLKTFYNYTDDGTQTGTVIDVDYDLKVESAMVYNEVTSGVLVDGDAIDLTAFIPKNIKQSDILTDLIKRYNAYIYLDPDKSNTLRIETRDKYFENGSTLDWTNKKDFTKKDSIKLLSELQSKEFVFSHKEAEDDFNENYTKAVSDEIYGQEKVIFDNEFIKGVTKVESPFAPTPLIYNSSSPVAIIPSIKSAAPETKPRVLHYGGLINTYNGGSWSFRSTDGLGSFVDNAYTTYPYAGHYDNPINPTLDSNFGEVPFEYYEELESETKSTLYNRYWKNYIEQLNEGKIVTSYFDLNEADIDFIKDNLNSKIFVRDAYFRINKIVDYNPIKKGTTKVELLKIKDGVSFVDNITTVDSQEVNTFETVTGSKGTTGNITNSTETTFSGASNRVGYESDNVAIRGSFNSVGDNAPNATVIGDNNTIQSRCENAYIINTDNVDITESNTGYISGVFYREGVAAAKELDNDLSDIIALRDAGTLVKGSKYYANDYDLTFTALATDSLSFHTTRDIDVIKPARYSTITIHVDKTPAAVDDRVIWGGRIWKCHTLDVGASATSDFEMNATYWYTDELTADYEKKTLNVLFDEDNLQVIESRDNRGNIVTSTDSDYHYFSDWSDDRITNNDCDGFVNNDCTAINKNRCSTIKNNVLTGSIQNNFINGRIEGCYSNAYTFSIQKNLNNGHIRNWSATANVIINVNVNNGSIGTGTSQNLAANITDTVVNK